jgi:hypothetical protein
MLQATNRGSRMMHFGEMLASLRLSHGLPRQRDFVRQSGWDPSRVSRLESAVAPDISEVAEYLSFIDQKLADEVVSFLQEAWTHVDQPSYLHPNRLILKRAESALEALESFRSTAKFVPMLEGRALSLRSELLATTALLQSEHHDVVMIGRIAVGKTTALCFLLDLLKVGAKSVGDVVLHASGGRTTLCEVQIRPSDRFAILIEPRSESEIYRLAAEICACSQNQVLGQNDEGALSVSKEVDKALRNMTGFQRQTKKVDGKVIQVDPVAELLRSGRTLEEVTAEFSQKLELWKRSERAVVADAAVKDGRQWLSEISRDINLGKDARFSLPQRVIIEVPRGELPEEVRHLTFLDTKGIDDTTVRPDIKLHFDNPRTVVVLCSRFPEAPATQVLELVDAATKTVGQKDAEARVLVLVLAQGDEALRIEDDAGNLPDDEESAYAIRRTIVGDALAQHGAGGAQVHFFNAASGDRTALRQAVVQQVSRTRQRWCDRIEQLALGVEDLIDNARSHQAAAVQREIGARVRRVIDRSGKLDPLDEPLYQAVLDAIQISSPRSICASTRRRGEWDNFDVLFLLGQRAELQAIERSNVALHSLQTILHEMRDDKDYSTGRRFLKEIAESAEKAQRLFSKEARQIAEACYRVPLAQADSLWAKCDNRWGQGSGYRNDLETYFREWFKGKGAVRELVESELRRVWQKLFVRGITGLVAEALDEEAAA